MSSAYAAPKKAAPQAPGAMSTDAAKKNTKLDLELTRSALPSMPKPATTEQKKKELAAVKPPRSGEFYEGNTKEAEYERLLDQEIRTLYRLSQQNRNSPNRGEVWLRLGERYVEKARLMDLRAQADYDKALKDYTDKKTRIKPKLNQQLAREYNEKAVQLYEYFIRDFPKDPKVDQALFFLGYNQFELGNTQRGEQYYKELVQRFPESIFVSESRFALGEYYFENEQWKDALDNYAKVIQAKKARLNTFALYKSSWCLYRLNRIPTALQALERVIKLSRAGDAGAGQAPGRRAVNKVRLASEAMKDYVPFYAEAGDPKDAEREFLRITGDEKQSNKMLERLAYIYADNGNRASAVYIFKRLISMDPTGERSAEYQYQIVLTHVTHDQKEFRKELELWLEAFGPESSWARQNAKNEKLVSDVAKLQETTLRNHVLQLHQAAQNSRAQFSQNQAHVAYLLYFKHFSKAPKVIEMRFFHAELLFDMGKYEDAAKVYTWVAEKDPKGPYHEKAVVNALLALEKNLPSNAEIDKKRGSSIEPMPMDPAVELFEKAAIKYIETFPKGQKTPDIQRRLGVLYYSYNQFDKALPIFEKLVKEHPKTENGEVAGNLILDIYKLKGDMIGLAEKGQEMLANPAIANSRFGTQVKGIMERASYMRAEKLGEKGESAKSAKEFETFAASFKQSDLAAAARIKAALAYEKAGDYGSAIRMHNMVLSTHSNDPKIKAAQNDSYNALARMYQQTGQLELAARQYQNYANANPKDAKAINAYYNAGVLWEGLGESNEAVKSYQAYMEKSKKGDRNEVLFNLAEMFYKKGQFSKALDHYEKYLGVARSRSNAIKATYMIGVISKRQGKAPVAEKQYQKTVAMYKASDKAARDESAKYAAEARFELAQPTLNEIKNIRFGTSEVTQGKKAQELLKLKDKYINEMKEVIRFDNSTYIVAALTSGGQMFDSMAASVERIQIPKSFNAEESKKYKELLTQQANGFRNEAKNSYKAAIEKAHALEENSNWTKVALAGLSAHEPGSEISEITSESRSADWMGL